MINQKGLRVLGLMAHSIRSIGFGIFLQTTLDFADFILLNSRRPPLKISLNGQIIYGCFRHRSFLHHLSTGNYEPFTSELFRSHLRSGMTVVDGGAHIGFYTLLAAQVVGNDGKVFSFEPDPYNCQCLVFNISKNDCKNISVIQKALSNRIYNAVFYHSSGTISSSLGYRKDVRSSIKGIYIKKISVQLASVDSELGDIPIDIIKFDLEGAECLALQGMSKILELNRSLTLFVEINPPALYNLSASPERLISILKSSGFEVCFIDELNRKLVRLNGEGSIKKGMLYCTRKC